MKTIGGWSIVLAIISGTVYAKSGEIDGHPAYGGIIGKLQIEAVHVDREANMLAVSGAGFTKGLQTPPSLSEQITVLFDGTQVTVKEEDISNSLLLVPIPKKTVEGDYKLVVYRTRLNGRGVPEVQYDEALVTVGNASTATNGGAFISSWRGAFSPAQEYAKGDLVRYRNSTWLKARAPRDGDASPGSAGSGWKLVAKAGKVGQIGPRGERGIAGPQGPQGEVGPKGAKGDVGERGPQGIRGPIGANGAQGPQGIPGPKGDIGPVGLKGDMGPPGEVRMPISSLPFTISQSGSYYLTRNLDGSAGGIDITASDVTLDLMGFTIDGGGLVEDSGVNLQGQSNVTVRNGVIKGFGWSGVHQGSPAAGYNRYIDLRVIGNVGGGPEFYAGIFDVAQNVVVLRSIAAENGDDHEPGFWVGSYAIIKDSVANSNLGPGIFTGLSATLTGNSANRNGTHGIHVATGSTLKNNTASGNDSEGIRVGAGSSVTGNTAYRNGTWGFFLGNGVEAGGNTAYYNNFHEVENGGGIFVVWQSNVYNNNVIKNYGTGIHVANQDNLLRENNVSSSQEINGVSRCIYFRLSNNSAVGNVVNGCSEGFSGNPPPAERFVDNIDY